MEYHGLESSLRAISKELERLQGRRERLLKGTRPVTSLSAKAVTSIHTGRMEEAQRSVSKAAGLLAKLKKSADTSLRRYLLPPEAEYTEASVLHAVATKTTIPSASELRVSGAAYLLGTLDAIGEVKRMVYDRIREGDSKRAMELFQIMEQLYLHLTPYAVYDHVAQGLKRKIDVARILVEDVRAAVTEEARRTALTNALKRLSNELGAGEKQRDR